jgi:UDP-N-acetylmuramoyl-tripeptide--D-alanyl-D-alanine ligase
MLKIRLDELLEVIDGKLLLQTSKMNRRGVWQYAPTDRQDVVKTLHPSHLEGVSIDSRTLDKGNIFFAIKGENLDGHNFVTQAIEKGASAVVITESKGGDFSPIALDSIPFILISDSKKALQRLALWYRKKFSPKVIAVTGTNGKTTTKDMIASVLAKKYKVLKSPKSYNNQIGLPLTLFQLNPEIEVIAVELGTSNLGEIGNLTQIALPDVGVITNIGPAHLETFASLERIAKAKFELLDEMSFDGVSVLNIDDKLIQKRAKKEKRKIVTYALENKADYQATDVKLSDEGFVSFCVGAFGNGPLEQFSIQLKLLGMHNVYNALAAFVCGELLGVAREKIKQALEEYAPSELRMELVKIGGIRIINDSYNANPVSMRNALSTLKRIENRGRKIAVLGDMLELGEKEIDFHKEIGRFVASSKLDLLLTVGTLSNFIASEAKNSGMDSKNIISFHNNSDLRSYLKEHLVDGDLILVKGSRKMKLEEVVKNLKNCSTVGTRCNVPPPEELDPLKAE